MSALLRTYLGILCCSCCFWACETSSLMSPEQDGVACEKNTNEFGRCNRDQSCEAESNSCVKSGEYCEDAPDNHNGFQYCLNGYACSLGECVLAVHTCNETKVCPEPLICRSGTCVCGENGLICGTEQICCQLDGGACINKGSITEDCMCQEGTANCDTEWSNGCESDLANDSKNCGACGEVCPLGSHCNNGSCELACPEGSIACQVDNKRLCVSKEFGHILDCDTCVDGFADCNNNKTDGCETDLGISNKHCGRCDLACPIGSACNERSCVCSGAQLACDYGKGVICIEKSQAHLATCNTCEPNFGNCDNDWSNGCETNLASSNQHCGECGKVCAEGTYCSSKQCKASCAAGEKLCPVASQNVCLNLNNLQLDDCGKCKSTHLDCNENAGDGCESAKGTLHITACKQCANGYANCDNNWNNGCETNLVASNLASCGVCKSGFCSVNGICKDQNTTTNGCGTGCTDCGAYTNVAAASCSGGACVINTCTPGFGNCDGNISNGCETNISGNDNNNCGQCGKLCTDGNACTVGDSCVGGTCKPGVQKNCNTDVCKNGTCNTTTGDCSYTNKPDGTFVGPNQSNRCCGGNAVDISSDPNNCGFCGMKCLGGACESVSATSTCSSSFIGAPCEQANMSCQTCTGASCRPATTSGRCKCTTTDHCKTKDANSGQSMFMMCSNRGYCDPDPSNTYNSAKQKQVFDVCPAKLMRLNSCVDFCFY